MTHKPKHRNATPNISDPEYQKIVQAFNINPGNPLPLRRHGKPFVAKRALRRIRR